MKRIFLLPCIVLSAWQLNAQTNNLVIFDEQGEPFYAIVNGIRQNNAPQTNVKVTGLNGNTFKVKVIFQDTALGSIDKTAFFQDNGTEETFNVITKKNGERVLRFVSIVPIPQAPPPPVQNQNVVSYNTTPPPPPPPVTSTTVVQQTTTTTTTDPNQNANITMNVGGTGVNMNVNGVQQTTVVTTTTTTSGNDMTQPPPPVQQQAPPPPPGCVPMMHDDYESAKNSITQKDFEDTKLSLAKQITTSNNLTAEQIRGIMKLFGFENTKLEYAKFAYDHCCDKSNYYKVDDAFEFDSSTTELNNYISSH